MQKINRVPYVVLLFTILLFPFFTHAQLTKEEFGKNRLQYKVFNWQYYSTNNFDVYFYDDGKDLAKLTADYMEDEYDRITDVLGYAPYSKTKIFLYNSIADLQQSNVGVNQNNFSVGGQTNFVKSHVEVAFPGTLQEFKEELVYKVSHMLIMDMMFGGSLTDIFQNTYLMTLPDWFIEGAARYVAFGWSIEMDDFMRDLLIDGKTPKMSKLKGKEAAYVGQSIWNYIAEKYGRSSISSILNYTRIIRNEETAIANTLGMPFKYFLIDWRGYYTKMTTDVKESYTLPQEANIIADRRNVMSAYNSVSISPSGRYIAYTENVKGKYSINVRDLKRNKTKTVIKTGYKVIDQEADDTIPLVDWQDDETIAVIGVKRGLYILYLHSLASNKTSTQVIRKISQVNDFKISPNGKVLVMSAEKDGQNDIYLYSIQRSVLRKVTDDIFDDITPTFIPGSNHILFSSNRTSDSLITKNVELRNVTNNYNLFVYNIDTTTNVLARITNTISKDYKPIADSVGNIYFLSDQRGIVNLFKYNLQDSLYKQLTNYYTSIQDYSISFKDESLAFILLNEGSERVYYNEDFDLSASNFTKATERQSVLQARYVFSQVKNVKPKPERKKAKPDKLVEDINIPDSLKLNQEGVVYEDSLRNDDIKVIRPDSAISTDTKKTPADTVQQDTGKKPTEEETILINTDNYVFDKEVKEEQKTKQESFLSTYRKLRRRNVIQGPYRLEPRFMVNNLITSWAIDPLRSSIGAGGVGFVLEGQLSDLLENHKFFGGMLAMTDLRSGDLFLEYQYLKYMLDFHARYDRKVLIQPFATVEKHKYILNRIEVGASLPLSISTRITLAPVVANARFVEITANSVINPNPTKPTDLTTTFTGLKGEIVFDNTIVKGFNVFNGTKAKIKYEHLLGIGEPSQGFGNLMAEVKNYFPISRDFIFATRGFFGSFSGKGAPSYILGGMDNWIINKTDDAGRNDPLISEPSFDNRKLLFHEFVTPMRGFNYNALNGHSVLVFNAELRFPLIKYFYRGPISSNFFRNLQVVGFYDIGSAWSGDPPFYRANSINTEVVDLKGSPFKAVIQNYKNPWLSSYGFGVRTVLFGYYFKFDVAYPIVDYDVKDTKFYLTFGYDF